MGKELAMLRPLMDDIDKVTVGSVEFITGRMGAHEIVAMECGIGKVNAAIGAVTMIDAFHPDVVINTGVAAGAGDNVQVLDTVVADALVHHDFWCIGEEWGRVPGMPLRFPAETVEGIDSMPSVKTGLIATGELFITSREQVDRIKEHFPEVLAIDMESAAIAQACHVRGVRFICMRVISDTPWCHHDNSRQYATFWEDAPCRSFEVLERIIATL